MVNVTMADVAEKAGVSKSTVSQYLSKRYEYMSVETRKKIEQAIKELDYRPNVLARSLKQKRSSTIGVIVANIMHSFSTEICRAIEDYYQEQGMNVILCNTDEDGDKEKSYIEMLQAKQVDGMILFPTGKNKSLYKKLTKQRIPILFVDRKVEGVHTDTVVANNADAVYQAVKHLADQGHRKIAILTAPLTISSRIDRVEGFKRAVQELGLDSSRDLTINCEIGQIRGRLQSLLSREDKPTAIIAGNDLVLMEILAYIKENRIRVPEELALLVFDNIPFAHLLSPTLTTISQPSAEMGRAAGRLLHERIKAEQPSDQQPPREMTYECTLIVRESSQGGIRP
ncbi:LacI family DNA-binding transcriptional regulator [Cohnella thermotolerans]|uniref:LacI family DNA-binding transcriptional regulator n=1 Tax=Cohnella thermotolerans TaxID=329858 RepID=UPI000419B224|nr:substrate-binding domain-containing protein [Cohnella thermotolerans]